MKQQIKPRLLLNPVEQQIKPMMGQQLKMLQELSGVQRTSADVFDERKKSRNLPPITYSKEQVEKQVEVNKFRKVKQPKVQVEREKEQKKRVFQADTFDQKAIILCQFCGGISCPQQDYLTNKIQPNAIQGLHSNWITQNILAMQRPSQRLILKHNLPQVFHQYKINSILNLQQPGQVNHTIKTQHPYCGDGIFPQVGFSYRPQMFFNHRVSIRYENQFWQDMTSTTFQQMMRIMNVFYKSVVVGGGKIAVHCHAGRGRTLMAICAWLIYNDRMSAQHTIQLAILKRQGVLTRTSQRDFLRQFQAEVQKRWMNFSIDIALFGFKTFSQFVSWQNVALLKSQRQRLNQTAFLHGSVMAILRRRMRKQYKEIIFSFLDLNDKTVFADKKWDKQNQLRVTFLKTYLNEKKFQKITQNEQVRVLVCLLQDFYDNLPFTVISLHTIDLIRRQSELESSIIKNLSAKRKVKKQNLTDKVLNRKQKVHENQINNPTQAVQNTANLGLQSRDGFYNTQTISEGQLQKGPIMVRQQNTAGVENGANNLENGANNLENGANNLENGANNLENGANNLENGANNLENGANNLENGANNLENGANNLPNTISQNGMSNGFAQLSLKSNLKELSQIQINTLYLNVLIQPSIVHQVGLSSLCTFIDFLKFAMELISIYRENQTKQTEEHFQMIQKCLLAKLSIILQSKKRYFPLLFRGLHFRQSCLVKRTEKLEKYTNKNVSYMAEVVMKCLIQELQVVLRGQKYGDDQHQLKKLIFKLKKVEANVDYFSKSYSNSGCRFLSAYEVKKVYDQARI